MKALRWLCFALMLAAPVLAAPADPPAQGSFGESVDVRVVNVEAVVTDRKGEGVRGLTAADFRLLVDGKEVAVDYFTEVESGEVVAPRAAKPEAKGPAAPAAPAAAGEKVGINYLVFVDDRFSITAQRNLVLRNLMEDLDRLRPEDRMAVLAFDGRHIDRLSDWTADRQALERTLAVAQVRPTFGLAFLAERRSEGTNRDLLMEEGGATMSLAWNANIGVQALVAAMRGTPAPAGRKVLVFLNGGLGVPQLSQELGRLPSAAGMITPEELLAPVFGTANLLGYTIYAVDVQGMDPQSTWADASIPVPVPQTFITTDYERGVHDALEVLAKETGGKAVLNSARLDAFQRVAADTRSYYWLGFSPEWKADGSHHDIRLEVRRAGLRVRSRTGFSDFSRADEAQVQAASTLLYGGQSTAPPLAVTLGEPRRTGLLGLEVRVGVDIPVSALTPLPAENGWTLAANLFLASREGGMEMGEWRTLPIRIAVATLPEAGGMVHWETELKLTRSSRRLVVALGGDRGEIAGWAELDLESAKRE
jgi:VWFA-related protein